MSLMRPFSSLREDFNRLFKELDTEFFSTTTTGGSRMGQTDIFQNLWAPPVDVIDQEKEILVKVQVPGITPDKLDIDVEDNMLTLTGETAEIYMEPQGGGNVVRQEIAYGKFFRRIPLPSEVQPDKAKAEFENGILMVRLPKSGETRRHKIRLGGGQGTQRIGQNQNK